MTTKRSAHETIIELRKRLARTQRQMEMANEERLRWRTRCRELEEGRAMWFEQRPTRVMPSEARRQKIHEAGRLAMESIGRGGR